MKQEENIDDPLLENIEGLLFSEAYADSEDNTSLISEIIDAEVPAYEGNRNGDGEDAIAKDQEKTCIQKNNVKENVLNIDFNENFFEIGFESLEVEKIRDSILSYRGSKFAFTESSIKESLIANTPIGVYNHSKRSNFDSYMKAGLNIEPLRRLAENLNISDSSFTDFGKKVFPMKKDFTTGNLLHSREMEKESTDSPIRAENKISPTEQNRQTTAALPKIPAVSKTTKNFTNQIKGTYPTKEALDIKGSNNSDNNKEIKPNTINTEPSKVLKISDKPKDLANLKKTKICSRDILGSEKTNKSKKCSEIKFSTINAELSKVLKDSNKSNPSTILEKTNSRKDLGVEKSNKPANLSKDSEYNFTNTEQAKASSAELDNTKNSINLRKAESTPKKDFSEIKSNYKKNDSNNAIFISGDKSLNITSSYSQKQISMRFNPENNRKGYAINPPPFNAFRKVNHHIINQNNTSFFSLTERSITKRNSCDAPEKKTRTSLLDTNKKAYDRSINAFKKKEPF